MIDRFAFSARNDQSVKELLLTNRTSIAMVPPLIDGCFLGQGRHHPMRHILLATPALMTLGFFLAGCSWFPARKAVSSPPSLAHLADIGQVAPDLDGEDTSGRRLRLGDFRGKVVVLHFWANW